MPSRWRSLRFDPLFTHIRQLITFGLGVWVIVYAVTSSGKDLGYILAGFALLGLIPVERVLVSYAAAREALPRDKPSPES